MKEGNQSFWVGIGLVFMATVCWSLSGVFVRHVPELDGWQINCWRGLSTSAFLGAYLLVLYRGDLVTRVQAIPPVALLGVFAFFAIGSTLYVTALTLASTANVAAMGATAPVFTAALSGLVVGERMRPALWASVGLCLAGVTFMVWNGMQGGSAAGNLVALVVAFCFAMQTLMLRRYRHFDMIPAIFLSGLVVFALGLVFDGWSVSWRDILILSVMGPIQLAIPLIFYARGARSVPAVTLSVFALLDTVFNPFWTWLGVGERASLNEVMGALAIVSAVMICILVTARRPAVIQPAPAAATP